MIKALELYLNEDHDALARECSNVWIQFQNKLQKSQG